MLAILWALLQETDPDRLVEDLQADPLEVRARAAESLRALGRRAIPSLERGKESGDPEVRSRIRGLLRDVGAPSMLVEDLRADSIPGNARAARNRLVREYGPEAKPALLEAIKSDDDQQAIQAAFVLAVSGDAAAALAAGPSVVQRATSAFVRRECEGFEWVAGHVILRLGSLQPEEERRFLWSRALRGIPPHGLHERMIQLRNLSKNLGVPFPRPLLDYYLRNFRDDNRGGNAFQCWRIVRPLGTALVPSLRAMVDDPDPQARQTATEMLLELGVGNLPPCALVEWLGRLPQAEQALSAHGNAALPALEAALDSPDRLRAIHAVSLVVRLRPDRASSMVSRAMGHLETDNFRLNALKAAQLLLAIGEPALPALRVALESDDAQTVVYAAWVLASTGKLGKLGERATRMICWFSAQSWEADEPDGLVELLKSAPGLRESVASALNRKGLHRRAEQLRRTVEGR